MSLAVLSRKRLEDGRLTEEERALIRCELARELESSGKYEDAEEALGDLWVGEGNRPPVERFNPATQAEILLRAGTLTGWVGDARQIKGSQERAKDLIGESISLFQRQEIIGKVAEAQTELAYCYWRLGEYDNARIVLNEAISALGETDSEIKAIAILRKAIVESSSSNFKEALQILNAAAGLFERSASDALRGKFYVSRATFLINIDDPETNEKYADLARVDYAAASYHFERAGHKRYRASVESELGFLHRTRGEYAEAHEHHNRARKLFLEIKDRTRAAQVDESEAQVFIAERNYTEAEKCARAAVQTFERGDETGLLIEALNTLAVAEARNGRKKLALADLRKAADLADLAGEYESMATTEITILEEVRSELSEEEVTKIYAQADEHLSHKGLPKIHERLRNCAREIILSKNGETIAIGHKGFLPATEVIDWEGFSLTDKTQEVELAYIERALADAGGSVTKASRMLGFKHHNSLSDRINRRGRGLEDLRLPVKPRRRSLMKKNKVA